MAYLHPWGVLADLPFFDGFDDGAGQLEEGFLDLAIAFGADLDPFELVLLAEMPAFLSSDLPFVFQIVFIANH